MVLFLFLVIALVVVVGAVTLAVVGGGESAALPEAAPERFTDPLPADRPLRRADMDAVRFPTALRGYHMGEVDDVLGRVGAELAERDARIAELEAALAGAQATAVAGPALFEGYDPRPRETAAGDGAEGGTRAQDATGDARRDRKGDDDQ
ncbi:DivIVA domain-containing protein [Streptomyces sp. G44]|uniref:DivIVA domain-containing protein n=1 Tax=Streptomyces sp. G44 TaxID=2807632 RepID=UPI00195F4889|nr:DivIVA domain-containing protein [Streptomyces sp. G44]MBM7173270.1 DivIVA domain-containing protein [Streptomyces sp. G44]